MLRLSPEDEAAYQQERAEIHTRKEAAMRICDAMAARKCRQEGTRCFQKYAAKQLPEDEFCFSKVTEEMVERLANRLQCTDAHARELLEYVLGERE